MFFDAYHPPSSQGAVQRHDEQEGDAGGADMTELRHVAGLIGIHMRHGRRRIFHRMMIEHDDIETGVTRGGQWRNGPCATIHRDDKRRRLPLSTSAARPSSGHILRSCDQEYRPVAATPTDDRKPCSKAADVEPSTS